MANYDKKLERVYNWVRAYIDENKFSDNQKLPSENHLSRKLEVSRSTVRDALALLANEGLVYKRRGSGTYINKAAALSRDLGGSSNSIKIGVILQGQDSNANSGLLDGIRSVFDQQRSDLRVFFTDNKFSNERYCLESVAHQGFSGFIVDGVKASLANPNLDCYRAFYQRKLPVIFYNNYYKELRYPRVIIDDHKCADELVFRLIRAGHRQIAGIFVYDNYQSIEKFHGYVKALQHYGVRFNDDEVKWCISNEAHGLGFAKEIARFLRAAPKCTAILCCNYMILRLVQKVLAETDRSVPEDYSLVCFDYSKDDWKQAGITCSVHPGYEMGRQVALRLLRMIENGDYTDNGYSCSLPPQIYDGRTIRTL